MEKQREGSMKKVMVVIEESDYSYHALIWALENLKESFMDSSPLFLFATQPIFRCNFAVSPSLGFARLYSPLLLPTVDLITQNQEMNKKVSLGILEKAKTICSNIGVKVKSFTEVGDPRDVICNAVQEHNINLLVVGDNSHGFLKRALQGSSLADYCLNNAKCPVLVVKTPA